MRNKVRWFDVLLLVAALVAALLFSDPLAVLEMDRANPTQSAPAR